MSFISKTKAYEKWLVESGVSISEKVAITDFREVGQGRGMVAVEDIAKGVDLFTIPRTKLLNVKTCSLVVERPECVEAVLAMDSWKLLIVVLAWEWKKGAGSAWSPYFDVLPLNDPVEYKSNQLMEWSELELKMLAPSLVVERIGRDTAEEMYDQVMEVIRELNLKELESLTLKEYHTVASVIMSYSFDVTERENKEEEDEEEDDDEEEEGDHLKSMVPLADTLNADTNLHNASLVDYPETLVMKSMKAIKKGEQVYNTYSDHPNAEILRRYGYVEANGSTQDFGEIPLETIEKSFPAEQKDLVTRCLEVAKTTSLGEDDDEDVELVSEAYDCFATGEVIPELVVLVQFLVVVTKINEQTPVMDDAGEILRILKKCVQLIESQRLTKGFAEKYTEILKLRLQEYPVEEKEDPPVDITTRAGMATVVLRSERKSLETCANLDRVFDEYKFIDDDKLLRSIMKKRSGSTDPQPTKRSKK